MKIINEYRDLYPVFTGDIHGGFRKFTHSILEQFGIRDCLVVVCGDIGMGFYKRGYYADEFQIMQTKFSKSNVVVAMVRGNHDNPVYFNSVEYSEYQCGGAYPNVFLVPDLSILHTAAGKVLCVGGAISIDRSVRATDISWWSGENMILPTESELEEIASEKIDIVATHSCPLSCGPRFNNAMGFEKQDTFLMSELHNERLDFDCLLDSLKKSNPVKYWFYGHFHNHYSDEIDGVRFTGLDMLRNSGADIYKMKDVL